MHLIYFISIESQVFYEVDNVISKLVGAIVVGDTIYFSKVRG